MVRLARPSLALAVTLALALVVACEDPLVTAYREAVATHASGDPDGALVQYEAILEDPNLAARLSPNAAATMHNNAGGVYFARGDAHRAHAHFARAVELHPDHAEALVNLALVLSEDLRRHDDAVVHARRAVGLRPNHPKSHHLLGNILQRVGQHPEAHLRFKTAEALAAGRPARAPPGTPRWRAESVGNEVRVDLRDGTFAILETVSVVPPVFRARGFLSPDERARVVALAEPHMERSRTVADADADGSEPRAPPPRVSETAWLATRGDATLEAIAARAMALLRLPPAFAAASERLQVLRYEPGGYFGVHHESTAFLRRFATALYYLGGPGDGNGGETAFPLGPDGRGGVPVGDDAAAAAVAAAVSGGNVTEACRVGISVSPEPGDALLFYNFDDEGEVDGTAMHAACPVTSGVKWAANHWFNIPETGQWSSTKDDEL